MNELRTITDSLNPAQREAVTAELRHLLVLAGAGSGKTRVLVHRIAYLMAAHHVSPHEILAVTFTNKAAAQMRNRIEKLHGVPMHHMWVGTFHGLAHRLLRTHCVEAKLPQTFQIMDADDQLRLVKRIHRAMNLEETWQPKRSQWFINHQKENGTRAGQVTRRNADYAADMLQKIYAEYEVACERSGLVDFTELLLRSHELLQNNAAIRSHYQQRFSHILVDEFQDTNTIQYRWLCALTGKNTCLMAVGDDDQSIYSWRGAQIKNLHHFSKDFKNVQTIRLEQNYRSTKNILDAANAVIKKNNDRLGKTLWTSGDNGELISLFEAFNERDEANQVIAEIKQLSRQAFSFTDFAILYRSNAQSRVMEEALLEAKIPYRVFGGFKFFERAEIKDALAYLRLLINHHDDAAFERIINTPGRGIGQTTLAKIRDIATQHRTSLWETTEHCLANNTFPVRTHGPLELFIVLMSSLFEETKQLKLADCVDVVLKRSGLLPAHCDDQSEKELSRIDNLKELISATADFSVKSDLENMSEIEAFLAAVVLETGEQSADAQTDCVSLMTLHAAKGLEFPVVFMVGMEEYLFPHPMAISQQGGLEEERRLCYVGMTRAMKKLFLTRAEYRHLHNQSHHHTPSRFIAEIPDALLHRVHPTPVVLKSNTYAFENASYFVQQRPKKDRSLEPQKQVAGFSMGQRVSHATFGFGTILGFEGSGDAARVQIKFEKKGATWLILRYANLR